MVRVRVRVRVRDDLLQHSVVVDHLTDLKCSQYHQNLTRQLSWQIAPR